VTTEGDAMFLQQKDILCLLFGSQQFINMTDYTEAFFLSSCGEMLPFPLRPPMRKPIGGARP